MKQFFLDVVNNLCFFSSDKSTTQKLRRRAAHFEDGASDSCNNGMEESWLVTPPQCFNSNGKRPRTEVGPMENLLIEHPSMSIYHGKEEEISEVSNKEVVSLPTKRDTHKAIAGRLQALEKRPPLRDLNKSALRKQNSSKNVKRRNQVYVRQHGPRKNKQYGRMTGKHTAVVGKRAA